MQITPFFRSIALLAALAALDSPAFASKEKPVVGISLDTLKQERWQHDRDTIEARVKALGGTVIATSANGDDTRQVSDIDALISNHVDVIIVVPHNGEALTRAVKAAKEAGIPIIAYDRLILNCDIDLYVTFDNVKIGALMAQYVVDRVPKDHPGRIVCVYGAQTDNNAKLLKQGQDSVLLPLVKAGKINIVHADWAADWNSENGKKIVNAAIAKSPQPIDGVVASADSVAGGVCQALLEEHLAGKVIVTGQDADLAACQRVMRGSQTMTIYKPLKQLADYAAQAAFDLAQGKKISAPNSIDNGFKKVPAVFQDVTVVDKDNMFSTVVKDGFQKAEDLK